MDLLSIAKDNAEVITAWRRDLHQIPEIGLNLPQTSAYVRTQLDELGIPYTVYKDHSGICATIGNRESGKCVALRADMDGLPIEEKTELPYRSGNSNMHACGHDAHTAMLLGAARILNSIEDMLPGCVKLIFQPGEETGEGAKALIADGVLDDPKVHAIIALHVDRTSSESVRNGDIIIKRGPMHASNDEFEIAVHGRSGHGGYPHHTVDPVVCAGLLINTLQCIISREIDPLSSAVISVGSLRSESDAPNIIPESVKLRGTIRCGKEETRDYIFQRMKEIAEGLCRVMRAGCEVSFVPGEPPVENNDELADIVEKGAKELFGEEHVHELREQTMGAEDAGYYFRYVPGCLIRFCNPLCSADGTIHPLHSGKMIIDDVWLYRGSALLVKSALDILDYLSISHLTSTMVTEDGEIIK